MEEDWALTLGLSGLAGEPGVFQEGSQLLTKREAAPPRPLGPLRRLQALQRPGRPSAPPPLVPVPPGNRRYPRWLKKASQSSPPWPLSVPPPIFPALAPPPGSSHPLSLGHRISWEASPCSAQRPWDFFPPIERDSRSPAARTAGSKARRKPAELGARARPGAERPGMRPH
ncbi:proline-rich receptor-like protein kinase PERK9 isoform X4 [Mustela erminea]|uniref:proline-rich receptor-like protein kinase PERK9 isoform X4 n=1 Tax=Mustela erminea TaxID=36723 RepID=UPI0013869296|nr:proline-rich receptor-like protein kinase PERK9 isoform X4 [Mustela erminea]